MKSYLYFFRGFALLLARGMFIVLLMLVYIASPALPSFAQEATNSVRINLTTEERAFLVGKQLRLGVDSARPPFEYFDEKGTYTGISAEFIKEAAKRLGITVVPQKEVTWNEALKKVTTGEIDIIPKITPSAEREKFLVFTRPYTTFPSVIVTRKDRLDGGLNDLRGIKVGVNKGQIVEANLRRDYPELSLVTYSDIKTGLRALATGKCEAYIDNLGAVAYTIDTVGLANLRITASTPYTQDLAFGVRKDWPLLASALDKALAGMTVQERLDIKNRWLAVKYQVGIPWRTVVPIGTALLMIIAFVLAGNRRLGIAALERERSEQKIKAMSQAVVDALVMIDSQGKVRFWNNGAEKLFGYTAQEAMGMDFHDITAPTELRDKAQEGIRQFKTTGHGTVFGSTIETTAINGQGYSFPVEISVSPFKVDNSWFAVGTVRDITERKRLDSELKQHLEELERFSRLTINREEKMIKLKDEINSLLEQMGRDKKYKIIT